MKTARSTSSWILWCAAAAALVLVLLLVASIRSSSAPKVALPAPHDATPAPTTAPPGASERSQPDALATQPASGARLATPPVEHGDGAQSLVHGVIRARGTTPIAGAEVRLSLDDGERTRELARVSSAADGSYALPADALAALELRWRGGMQWIVAVSAADFQPGRQRRPVPDWEAADAQPTVIDVRLVDGRTLHGRVLDAAHAPVARASVTLFARSVREENVVRTICAQAESGPDGRFTLGFVSSGTYDLAARAEKKGTALLEGLELDAQAERELADLALQGSGTLAGVVRYPDASAASAVELWAIPEAVAQDAQATASAVIHAQESERDDGLYYGTALSDAQGRFAFAGLRAGNYALRSPRPNVRLEAAQPVFATGAQDIALTLDAQRVRLETRDASGKPLCGVTVACARLKLAADGRFEVENIEHATTLAPECCTSFEVEAQTTYALSARQAGCREVEEFAVLAPAEREQRHVLVLERSGAPGKLRISISGARGERLQNFEVLLESPLSGQPIEAGRVWLPDDQGVIGPIAAGKYELEIGIDERGGADAFYFPIRTRQPVEVRAGETTTLELVARAGGRLRIALDIAGAPPPGFAFDPGKAKSPKDLERKRSAHELAHSATIELVPRNGGPPRLLQFALPAHDDPARTEVASRLLPGTSGLVLERLEAGEYELRAHANGFQSASTTIRIEVARLLDVRLELAAQ